MAILYNIVTIENYADNAATEAALNTEGADDWDLVLANFKPNPQTGKPNSTIIFKRTTITSSSSSSTSSSSSSSSSSLSSSSSSISSSSQSEVVWLGSGWPNAPDTMQVVIGSRWNAKPAVAFIEDDVIILQRVSTTPGYVRFSEDGTTIYNWKTNRLMFSIAAGTVFAKTGISVRIDVSARTYNDAFSVFSSAVFFPVQYYPYNFKDAFNNSKTFTSYADTDYVDVSTSSGFTPVFQYVGELFKSMTFISG